MANEKDRARLLEELFEGVRNAAAAFYGAAGEHVEAMAEFRDPDGAPVVQAARRERHALQEYNRSVRALSDSLALES